MSTDVLLTQHSPLMCPDKGFDDLFERTGYDQRDDGTFTWVRMHGPLTPPRLSVYPAAWLTSRLLDRMWPGMYGLAYWCHRLASGAVLVTAAAERMTHSVGLTVITERELRKGVRSHA